MTIKTVKFLEEVDNLPEYDYRQGCESVTNYRIYEITNDDGSVQHLKLAVEVNSYGNAEGVGGLTLAKSEKKTVTVWK